MTKWLVLFLALTASGPVLAQAVKQPPPAQCAVGPATTLTPAPDERAKQWLSLIDDSNYGEAWRQAGAFLHGQVDTGKFQTQVSGVREPLGAMATRNIKDIKMSKTLPGMRDGQYAVVQFDSSFAHKASAVETVTLTLDNGAWTVVGYHIN